MYTIRKRSYDKSMTGTISPISSPDAGCGLNKSLTMEPEITNIRGYVKVPETEKDYEELQDVNLFSVGELTMPGAARNDDPSRCGGKVLGLDDYWLHLKHFSYAGTSLRRKSAAKAFKQRSTTRETDYTIFRSRSL